MAPIDWPALLCAGLASLVEFIEALTIVLAVGVVQGYKNALIGALLAVLVLASIIAALGGTALQFLPLHLFELAAGVAMLVFGARWLKKAVLRAAGRIPLRDEAKKFSEQLDASQGQLSRFWHSLDLSALGTAFNGVFVEGMEVAFIVIAVGTGAHRLASAALGAAAALGIVVVTGALLRGPITRVPENSLKFAVGVMVLAIGTLFILEGAGLTWRGQEWASAEFAAGYLALALCAVGFLKTPTARLPG